MVKEISTVPRASSEPLPELAAFLQPYAVLFRNRQSGHSVERYLTGLLTDLPRKNCQTVAASVVGTSTERLQHLLTDAVWDPQALDRARVQTLVAQSPAGGILVLDDTGLPKRGTASVGAEHQYSGTLGKQGACQVVVSAEYVVDAPTTSTPLHWPVTAQLYVPQVWAGDPPRRRRAHIPDDLAFAPKTDLALALLERARAWGSRFTSWWPTPAMATPLASWRRWSSGRCRMSVPWAKPSASGSPTKSTRSLPHPPHSSPLPHWGSLSGGDGGNPRNRVPPRGTR